MRVSVPESTSGKNRVHLDIAVNDLEHAAEWRVELVATRVDGPCGDSLGDFIVLSDSEGERVLRRHRLIGARFGR